MIPPAPRSTLFPYTTLFRSFIGQLQDRIANRFQLTSDGWRVYQTTIEDTFGSEIDYAQEIKDRSEEHTSELQSRGHLVCRLLLEKKKHKKNEVTVRGA